MQVGDLVQKRWGRIDWYQKDTAAVYLGPAYTKALMLTGPLIKVVYPDRKPELHKPDEFEVISSASG